VICPAERRIQPRFIIGPFGSSPLLATLGIVPRTALLCDASKTGLGVLCADPPFVGSLVPVWLAGSPGEASKLLLMRAVYSILLSPGLFRVGLVILDEADTGILNELLQRLGVDANPS